MAELDEMIAMVRSLRTLAVDAANEAAPLIEKAIKTTAAAGQTPDGKSWAPTKEGKKPMTNAASHITVTAAGPVVRMTLTGPDVFHHFGARGVRRQVIPDQEGDMPPTIKAAADEGVTRAFVKAMSK